MKIAVYCSSTENLPEVWQRAAWAVGHWIGEHKSQLIYGGVDAGLMRVVAGACKESGGTVVGIVPSRRANMESPFNDLSVPTADLNDRKRVMQLLADTVVVLPGGYGTLDEFATSFAYINFTLQRSKRLILLNSEGIYDPLLAQLQLMIDRGLMNADRMSVMVVANTTEELIQALDNRFNEKK